MQRGFGCLNVVEHVAAEVAEQCDDVLLLGRRVGQAGEYRETDPADRFTHGRLALGLCWEYFHQFHGRVICERCWGRRAHGPCLSEVLQHTAAGPGQYGRTGEYDKTRV